jgi:dTDP-glucose 4,6-dehydratase
MVRTLLVTGGAGFIGGCFVRMFANKYDTRIINLDSLTYAGNVDSLAAVTEGPGYHFVHGDIRDRSLVSRLLSTHHPDAIVHFAAESHVDRSIDGPRVFLETNVIGTFDLLVEARSYWETLEIAARDNFRFIHVSTDEVYGSLGPNDPAFSESTPYDPHSPYSASKAASDHFVRAFFHTYGLPTIVTNCSNNYGPYQFPEKLIPLMILNALERKPLPVYGDGLNVRDWLFVEDHCQAIHRVLEAGTPGSTYTIGGHSEKTNLEVIYAICETIDEISPGHESSKSLIQYVRDRPGHDRRYAIDTKKITNQLGWHPTQDFSSGLRHTVQWYLNNLSWVDRVATGSYRRERLGVTGLI